MSGQSLTFIAQVLELEEIGENTLVESVEYDVGQISRGLYWHGKQVGKKFSYTKTPNGYLITLVGFRDGNKNKFPKSKGFLGLGKGKIDYNNDLKIFKESAPDGTTHYHGRKYLKKLRTFKPRSKNSQYTHAYDYWDGEKWRWVACKHDEFLKIKPL